VVITVAEATEVDAVVKGVAVEEVEVVGASARVREGHRQDSKKQGADCYIACAVHLVGHVECQRWMVCHLNVCICEEPVTPQRRESHDAD
jgi:hypothetical protein